MTDPTPKPEPIPSDAQIAQWEASTAMALRVLRVLAEVTTSGEMASSGYLRKRCGLSAEEWHGSGELMASLICFASDKGFLEWHARDMVDAGHERIRDLEAGLEAAERERDEAIADRHKWMMAHGHMTRVANHAEEERDAAQGRLCRLGAPATCVHYQPIGLASDEGGSDGN